MSERSLVHGSHMIVKGLEGDECKWHRRGDIAMLFRVELRIDHIKIKEPSAALTGFSVR